MIMLHVNAVCGRSGQLSLLCNTAPSDNTHFLDLDHFRIHTLDAPYPINITLRTDQMPRNQFLRSYIRYKVLFEYM